MRSWSRICPSWLHGSVVWDLSSVALWSRLYPLWLRICSPLPRIYSPWLHSLGSVLHGFLSLWAITDLPVHMEPHAVLGGLALGLQPDVPREESNMGIFPVLSALCPFHTPAVPTCHCLFCVFVQAPGPAWPFLQSINPFGLYRWDMGTCLRGVWLSTSIMSIEGA